MHLPDPASAIARLVRTLRPGGWLLAEDSDTTVVAAADHSHPLAPAFDSVIQKKNEFLRTAGVMDVFFPMALPGLVEQVGLSECGNEAVTRIVHGGGTIARIFAMSAQRVDHLLVEQGVASQRDVADQQRAFKDPTFTFRSTLIASAWGRRSR
jgi:hypothetical protein